MSLTITAPTLTDYAGISRTQLNLWVDRGYLHTDEADDSTGPHRTFTPAEEQVARWMGLLVRHGLTPETAAGVARSLHETGRARLGLFDITTATPHIGHHLDSTRSHA